MPRYISNENGKKPVRVLVNGCFDFVHFGHANVFRQAKLLGDYLVVGVHSDEEVRKHKGNPIFTQEERYSMVRAIKWVDEVVEGCPYFPSLEILDKYNCDFVCHGDDIVMTVDGKDAYQDLKDAGRFHEVRRTQGISTAGIVDRISLATNTCHGHLPEEQHFHEIQRDSTDLSPVTRVPQFLATNKKIVQFSGGREAKPVDKIVYVTGAFDCLHVGHLAFLEKASTYGDYVIVGMHTDSEVNRYCGNGYPIMNLHERVLSVLACRYVDEVVIGAPYVVTEDLMSYLKVNLVLHDNKISVDSEGCDPYAEPKRQNKFVRIRTENTLMTSDIVGRIADRREEDEEFVKKGDGSISTKQ